MRLTWPLTGRLQELRTIEAAISAPNLCGIIVSGAAGVGKSRIAREAALSRDETVSSSSFERLEALEQNGDQLDRIRTAATTEGGAQVLDVGNFELAVARLGVHHIA